MKIAIFWNGITREEKRFKVKDLEDAYKRHEELIKRAGWDTTLEWINIDIEGEEQPTFIEMLNNPETVRMINNIEHGFSDKELEHQCLMELYEKTGYIYTGFNPFEPFTK